MNHTTTDIMWIFLLTAVYGGDIIVARARGVLRRGRQLRTENRQSGTVKRKGDVTAKIASCFNCIYSHCDHEQALWSLSMGRLTWPACANHPDSPGRMQRVPERGICRNYRSRPATPEGQVKQIPVGEGLYAYVDAADFDWLNQWTWHLCNGYAMRREKGKAIFLHHEIMRAPQGMVIDHRNRNKLDDTRANLHACTRRENALNRSKKRGSSSRFWGVGYRKTVGRWYAELPCERSPIFLGYFAEEIEAARAHDRGAVAYLGASARLNFPQEWPPERRAQVYAEAQEQRRKISARRKPGDKKGRKTTAGKKPRSARREKAATKGTQKSRSKRATAKMISR
jgi:hypothetical protein